ncbi:DUF1284 domain-containing protein [Halocynthiibacter sp.]|uniref:DUF1284 domain-containing protein n=1 Tax=Halocynthiibacter sp. TaxID=1979210 RepID=UPI003C3CA480
MSKTNSSENSTRIVPDNPTPTVQFRPHHFLCALGFQGKGYSDDFTANMVQIVDETLRAPGGDDQQIEVVRNTDDICAPCPKRRGLRCSNQDGIDKLDKAHLRALKLEYGNTLTWGEAKDRIRKHIAPEGLQVICSGCQWLQYGMCESAVRKLRS